MCQSLVQSCAENRICQRKSHCNKFCYKKVNYEKIYLDINTSCVVHHNGCACWLRATQTTRVPKQVRNLWQMYKRKLCRNCLRRQVPRSQACSHLRERLPHLQQMFGYNLYGKCLRGKVSWSHSTTQLSKQVRNLR